MFFCFGLQYTVKNYCPTMYYKGTVGLTIQHPEYYKSILKNIPIQFQIMLTLHHTAQPVNLVHILLIKHLPLERMTGTLSMYFGTRAAAHIQTVEILLLGGWLI